MTRPPDRPSHPNSRFDVMPFNKIHWADNGIRPPRIFKIKFFRGPCHRDGLKLVLHIVTIQKLRDARRGKGVDDFVTYPYVYFEGGVGIS